MLKLKPILIRIARGPRRRPRDESQVFRLRDAVSLSVRVAVIGVCVWVFVRNPWPF